MNEELDAVETFVEKNSRLKNKKFQNIDDKINDCFDPQKTKMVIEFNDRESASIKSFAVKKRSQVKVTTCFMSGKLLMFAKLSLKSFIYEISEIFCFPKENITKIYKKYMIEKVEIFHVLSDTDSTSLRFIFISDPISDIPESKFRDIILEVITASDIYKRFKFSQFNDKRFYFPDEVVLLSFGHPCLSEIDKFKQEKGREREKYFWKEKEALSNMEKKALKEHPRLYLYHQI